MLSLSDRSFHLVIGPRTCRVSESTVKVECSQGDSESDWRFATFGTKFTHSSTSRDPTPRCRSDSTETRLPSSVTSTLPDTCLDSRSISPTRSPRARRDPVASRHGCASRKSCPAGCSRMATSCLFAFRLQSTTADSFFAPSLAAAHGHAGRTRARCLTPEA